MTRRASGWRQPQPSNESSLWDCPDPNPSSVAIFEIADELPESMRKLIHEYGFKIVTDTIDDADGVLDPDELEFTLMQWRHRRQEEWLATDYFTRGMANSIRASLHMRQV